MNAYWALELPAPDPAPEPKRSEQLRAAARWIVLLADELDALEGGDHPRLRELQEERAKLAAELGGDDADDELSLPRPLHTEPVAAALRELREWAERERRTRDGIAHLRDESLPLLRSIPVQTTGGRYQVMDPMDNQLNVRL